VSESSDASSTVHLHWMTSMHVTALATVPYARNRGIMTVSYIAARL